MSKVTSKKDKEVYRISDFTSGDKVDESKFVEGISQRGKKRLETKVCVLYKDEYEHIIEEIDSLKDEVQHLKHDLNDKENEIKGLEKQIKENTHANIDEIIKLKDNHHRQIDRLKQEKSDIAQTRLTLEKTQMRKLKDLEKTHANKILTLTNKHNDEISQFKDDISDLKQYYLEEMRKKDNAHNDEREKIRTYFLKVVTKANKNDVDEIIELEETMPSIFKPLMRKHVKLIDKMKERKLLKEPEKIIKSYEISGQKEE